MKLSKILFFNNGIKLKMFENDTNDFWEFIPIKQDIIETIEYRKLKNFLTNKILIFAGAGMSQESGLPVFNSGNNTLLNGYKTQQDLIDLFDSHKPHEGYMKLLELCKNREYYVFTSNIDGYFSRAGFDKSKIIEIHGNIHYVQCPTNCNKNNEVKLYSNIKRVENQLCPYCHEKMVPNVMVGGFQNFIYKTKNIEDLMNNDIKTSHAKACWTIIEIGAGVNLPAIRDYSEILVEDHSNKMKLIRINPEHWQIPKEILSKNTVRIPHKTIKGIDILQALT